MGENPYVGQLLLVSFNFNPVGWFFCQGQLVPISQYDALYSLLGTTFGGDGVSTFGLPDLRGRVPIHQGTGQGLSTYVMGQLGGVESVTINSNTYPTHNHGFLAGGNSNGNSPTGNWISGGLEAFAPTQASGQMASGTIGMAPGSSLPHENRQPLLTMNWIIAFNGIYPSVS